MSKFYVKIVRDSDGHVERCMTANSERHAGQLQNAVLRNLNVEEWSCIIVEAEGGGK